MTCAQESNRQTHTHTHRNGQAHGHRRNLTDLPKNVTVKMVYRNVEDDR